MERTNLPETAALKALKLHKPDQLRMKIGENKYDVCIVSRYNPWSGSGLENIVKSQIIAFYLQGIKIALLFRSKGKNEKIPVRVNYFAVVDKLSRLSGALADILYAIPMYLKLRKIRAKVILDNFEFSFLYKLLKGRSLLIKVHHGTPNYLDTYSGCKKILAKAYAIFLKPLYSLLSRTVDLNIAVSNKVKNELVKYYHAPRERIIVIPNGVDLKRFKPRNKFTARAMFNLPRDAKIILFVGGDLDRKGFTTALKVVTSIKKEIEKVVFMIITSKKNLYKIDRMLTKDTKKWIRIFTDVPDFDMPYLYNSADILLLPSKYEGLSLTFLEALASGCPAIVSPNSADLEFNEKGYLIAYDLDDYIQFCKKLLEDQKYWTQMSLKARELVTSRYTQSKMYGAYREVIEKLVKCIKDEKV